MGNPLGRLRDGARWLAVALGRAARWLRAAWRWPLALALLGALLAVPLAQRGTHGWESQAQMVMRPTFLLEGYLLSIADLGRYYARRFEAPARLARAMAKAGIEEPPLTVEASAEPGTGLVTLRLRHADPAAAEALAAAMQRDFLAELQRENGTRVEQDRLWLDIAPATFARSAAPGPWRALLLGAVLGGLFGALGALARGYHAEQRVTAPLIAEQLTGVPTLAAIPWRGP